MAKTGFESGILVAAALVATAGGAAVTARKRRA
ncbi:LPXTG cell wall anchor domain-containing protein [uncultured Actinomyces sp.]